MLAQGRWFSPGTPASSTTKTGRHDIAEILLNVVLNTKIQDQIQIRINRTHLKLSLYTNCQIVRAERNSILLICISITTVVKELRSKMFGQHPGYLKAVFLKQTRIIIVSIYKYTVYIMFWIMMLYDCYYY